MSASKHTAANIYNIPAGLPFAELMAQQLLEETKEAPERLTNYKILLPTRRGCRHLRDAFLRLSEGRPLLLPRMQTIGDVDEDELLLDIAGFGHAQQLIDLPPALSPLRRQILMARLIMKMPDYQNTPDHALKLAKALGRLMDQIYNENLDIGALLDLAPEEFAEHWQITLEFLKIISETWPHILAEEGTIDAADRRNRLINALAAHWQANPPQTPIIVAGSTGSMPSTALLLGVVARLPAGRVILPGLDQNIDEESWQTLDDTHPQATLKNLLSGFGIERHQINLWPSAEIEWQSANNPNTYRSRLRNILAQEIMRPAETAEHWQKIQTTASLAGHNSLAGDITSSLEHLKLYQCNTQEEEARTIAILMREILESPQKTAALITPDRMLAKRVSALCQRWNISVDDSAGLGLAESDIGHFILLSLQAALEGFRPIALLSLLRHPFTKLRLSNAARHDIISQLDARILRGETPEADFDGIFQRIENAASYLKNASNVSAFMQHLQQCYKPLLIIRDEENRQPFQNYLKAHIAMMESLASREDMEGAQLLWRREDGETASLLFSNLLEQKDMPACTLHEYAEIIEHFLRSETVRTPYGVHPRLFIYGQLEARMTHADLVILGGLNEGTWPQNPTVDPWMSRPMRKNFGLPSYERSVGLAAHDFVQGICAPNVVLTRALKIDGAPTLPARWLQRLEAVLHAANIDKTILADNLKTHYLTALDHIDEVKPITRPAPCPPANKRPNSLYVTAIESWMRDPYSIYAKYILQLRKLDPLEDQADAALRGTIIHNALERFVRAFPDRLPSNALDQLLAIGEEEMQNHIKNDRMRAFWQPRFERLARWFIAQEQNWRLTNKPLQLEASGSYTLANGFTVKARADRIDNMLISNQNIAIIDYKTGSVPSVKDIKAGLSPQLPLEGIIAAQNGFNGIQAPTIEYLGFWQLTGGRKAGEEKPVSLGKDYSDYASLCADAQNGLTALVDCFRDDSVPYYSLPRPDKAPPAAWQDYAHLARVQEWSAFDDSEEAA